MAKALSNPPRCMGTIYAAGTGINLQVILPLWHLLPEFRGKKDPFGRIHSVIPGHRILGPGIANKVAMQRKP